MRKSIVAVILAIVLSVPVFGTDKKLNISAEAAVLIDAEDGETLFARGSDQRMQPASMKILTRVFTFSSVSRFPASPLWPWLRIPSRCRIPLPQIHQSGS